MAACHSEEIKATCYNWNRIILQFCRNQYLVLLLVIMLGREFFLWNQI